MANITTAIKSISDKIISIIKILLSSKNFYKFLIILAIIFLFFKLQAGYENGKFYLRLTTPTQDIKKK